MHTLRPGLVAVPVQTAVLDLTAPSRAEHQVLVNVGAPFQLAETLDGRTTRTVGTPGDVGIVPAGLELRLTAPTGVAQPVRSLAFLVDPGLLDEAFDAAGARPAPLVPVVGSRSPEVAALAGLVRAALAEADAGAVDDGLSGLALESLGHALVVAVARRHTGRPTHGPAAPALSRAQLGRVTRHVEDNLAAPLTLADLAAVAHVSPFHFARVFRSATGRSPHRYVLERRVALAEELLTRTTLPIAEVAARAGFADQSHLTRVLGRQLGRTPGAVRAASRD